MTRRPWQIARCSQGDTFVTAENEDENQFIYETFVKPSRTSLWMNARVCGKGKLCDQTFGTVYYHNFMGTFPSTGCVEMLFGKNGKWVAKDCRAPNIYVCKYGKYDHIYASYKQLFSYLPITVIYSRTEDCCECFVYKYTHLSRPLRPCEVYNFFRSLYIQLLRVFVNKTFTTVSNP